MVQTFTFVEKCFTMQRQDPNPQNQLGGGSPDVVRTGFERVMIYLLMPASKLA